MLWFSLERGLGLGLRLELGLGLGLGRVLVLGLGMGLELGELYSYEHVPHSSTRHEARRPRRIQEGLGFFDCRLVHV